MAEGVVFGLYYLKERFINGEEFIQIFLWSWLIFGLRDISCYGNLWILKVFFVFDLVSGFRVEFFSF